jgi:hypothetical protein
MSYAKQLLESYPSAVNIDADLLAPAIDALNDCAQACAADADADLGEQNVGEMVRCIRLCLDCRDVCTATVSVTSRRTEPDANVIRLLLESCLAACKSCGDECERHAAMHEHCRVCEEACRAASARAVRYSTQCGRPSRQNDRTLRRFCDESQHGGSLKA